MHVRYVCVLVTNSTACDWLSLEPQHKAHVKANNIDLKFTIRTRRPQ
jgi:hypothetical protein